MKYIIDLPDTCQCVQWINLSTKDGHAYFCFKSPEDLTPLDKELNEAYQKGFEAGQHEATTLEYQQGLNDAWEFIKEFGEFPFGKSHDVFGTDNIYRLVKSMSYLEAISKLKAYKEQQKAESEIKVGDEVRNKNHNVKWTAVVVQIDGDTIYLMGNSGDVADYQSCYFEKTGRHFPQVAELLKAMQGSEVTE